MTEAPRPVGSPAAADAALPEPVDSDDTLLEGGPRHSDEPEAPHAPCWPVPSFSLFAARAPRPDLPQLQRGDSSLSVHLEFEASLAVPAAYTGGPRRGLLAQLRTLWAYTGPGLMISVGYMDPGNWSTDITGGATFGYDLLFVVLLSSLAAMFLQAFSVRLGVASGRDLAQLCRERYPPLMVRLLWLMAEAAIAACDLAEVLGTAIALDLLFGIPLTAGVLITATDVLLLLTLAGRSARALEGIIAALLLVIGGCFIFTLAKAAPPARPVLAGFIPRTRILTNSAELYAAIGILGATVMPHNLYLHSAIVQSRAFEKDAAGRREAVAYATLDSHLALIYAGFVNAAILVVAATAFRGQQEAVGTLSEAARLLAPALGTAAATTVFGVGLLAAGQQSTLTGTLAGQVVMEGFLGPSMTLKPWARRLLTRGIALVPAVAIAATAGPRGVNALLNASQVALSLQLPFAIAPLVHFCGSPDVMGPLVISRPTRCLGWLLFLVISAANAKLVVDFISGA